MQAGLSITVELQRNTSNRVTRKHYESSQRVWTTNRQAYQLTKDYFYILKAEPPIVDNNHKILFENAAKFCFTEVSRQKNSDGTVGPINQRLNACGAALREFSHCSYLFPDPLDYGTQPYTIGQDTMEFRVAGYDGSSFGPKVLLAHPDLPSMDFGDAVRSHNEYIATFCAIHNAPVSETTRYSNLFLLLARPYLDYLYSEYKTGKSGFQKGVYNALRQIKELVREAGFQPTMYKDRRVSRNHEFDSPDVKLEFFDDQIRDAELFYGSEHALVTEVKRLKEGGVERSYALDEPEEQCLTVKDVEYIRDKAVQRAVFTGSIFHRRIASLFPSPWHINDVIFNGDRYSQDSKYVIVSELPVVMKNGVVKIDLVLFERTISADGKSVFWEPRLVLEIKTRKAQRWWIEPVFKKSEVRTIQRVVGEYPMDDLPMDDEVWEAITNSTPRKSTEEQLNTYVQTISDAFTQSTKRELEKILTGTIIVDSTSNLDSVRRTIEQLIVYAFKKMRGRKRRIKRTVFEPDGDDRIALVVHEQEPPSRVYTGVVIAPWGPSYNPFRGKSDSERGFILYLSGKSQTSGGQSAAWHARYHHGLQMLHDIQTSKNATDIVWIDLADQFSEARLAETRLRLRPRGFSEEELARVQPEYIREFFERIDVRGHLDSVLSFLYEDGKVPEFTIKRMKKKYTHRVIVITGADTLRDATPSSHRNKLKTVMDRLLNSLPDDKQTTVVWFDSPVPSVDKALPYSGRTLLPFYDGDSLFEVVTNIVWNLPVAPIGAVQPERWKLPIIGDSPMHDDIRVIIHHSPTSFSTELTHVPFLRGWSKRFRNKGKGLVVQDRELLDVVPDKSIRDRMKLLALTHIPWLVRLWPDETPREDSMRTLKELFRKLDRELRRPPCKLVIRRKLLGQWVRAPTILDLLQLRLPDTHDAKSYAAVTMDKINSQRLYRSPNRLLTKPLRHLTLSTQPEEIVVHKKPEIDTLFGIKFEDDLNKPWWMIIQDPDNEARMLVGCFIHRLPTKDGFLWAVTRQDTLTDFSVEDILGLTHFILRSSKTDAGGLQTWISAPDSNQATNSGLFEVIGSKGRSTVGHLRAFRQTHSEGQRFRSVSTTTPTELFYGRVVDSLRRYIESVKSSTPVTVILERVKNGCHVTITDPENDEVLQTVTLDIFADLISFLRWPMRESGPMYTDSGEYVTWSVFEDIEFGELDFVRPYVTFRASRTAPREIPERISQFFEEAETLEVGIEHDDSICPMVTEEQAVDHGECWRITLPSDCPEPVRQQLGQAMTGEEVNGLLSPGRLFVAGKLYLFDITTPTVSEKDESVVFYEDKYIRMLLRKLGLSTKRLGPGTYLHVSHQKWMVDSTWDGVSHFRWSAQSTVSGLRYTGGNQTVELVHGNSAEKECERILGIIISTIPEERIADYTDLEERVLSGLKNLGYSKYSPPCELRVIESTESIFSFGVYLRGGSSREPLARFTIEVSDGILDDETIERELAPYNIRNRKSFTRRLDTWMSKYMSAPEEEGWVESEEDSWEVPEVWDVTLFTNTGSCEIYWEATQKNTDEYRTGLLYGDSKVLLDGSVEEAEDEVRRAMEGDVVPELEHISNLKEVFEEQVSAMIQELRQQVT